MSKKWIKVLEVVSLILLVLMILMVLSGWDQLPDTVVLVRDSRGYAIVSGSRYVLLLVLSAALGVYGVTNWLRTGAYLDRRLLKTSLDSLERFYQKERILWGVMTIRCEVLVLSALVLLNVIAKVNVLPSMIFMTVMLGATIAYERMVLKV